ncbi:MAG: NUDIX domain-containing protein [Anaerolineae bacterium]|nr:NUDIX domain-containing protein [Anaerolineae bacterium]
MAFLRLGVQCAILDDEQKILLSRRSDLNVWGLPGGRLDGGESFADAAAREVLEETGLVVRVEQPVGLYFLCAWQRMNIVYSGWVIGGTLQGCTAETRGNQFFDRSSLPEMTWPILVEDAFSGPFRRTRCLEMSSQDEQRVRWRLRGRWLWNLLRGRPEPRFPRFVVRAVGLIWNDLHQRILVVNSVNGCHLPVADCAGQIAPWEELGRVVQRETGQCPSFWWVGLYEDTGRNRVDLVFAATVDEELELRDGVEWVFARTAPLPTLEAEMVNRVRTSYREEPVWTMRHSDSLSRHRTILVEGK